MGPRADLEGCEKSRPPPGFDPRTVQRVAIRYTAYAIPAFRTTVISNGKQRGKENVCTLNNVNISEYFVMRTPVVVNVLACGGL